MTSFAHTLRLHAAETPDAPAILTPDQLPVTFSELADRIDILARCLRASGLRRNDVVASVLPDATQTLNAFLGCLDVASFAPLNTGLREAEFEEAFRDLRPAALLVPAGEASCAHKPAGSLGIPMLEAHPTPEAGAGLFTITPRNVTSATALGAAVEEPAVLLLQTSATTGRAKFVPLTNGNLEAMAGASVQAAVRGPEDRFLGMTPFFHLQGLMSAIAQLREGGSVVCACPFDAARFPQWIEEFQPTWYTAGPALHRTILSIFRERPDLLRKTRLRAVRSIGSPLSAELLRELEETLSVPVIEGYGLTEAGAVTSTPLEPYRSKAGSAGMRLTSGVEIMDDAGNLLPAGRSGEIVLRGPNVVHGYYNNPEASRAAFRDGWFRTGDLGCFDEEGYLYVTGRIKEIVNRGGEKIVPDEIDRVLLAHPSIAEAAAFAIPHPQLGDDLAVAVVVRKGAALDEVGLRAFVAGRLADFKVPRVVRFVDTIPRGATGKVQRSRLAEEFVRQEAEAAVRAGPAPATDDERKLAEIWAAVLGIPTPGVDQDFFELGGHSLASSRVLTRIEERFGIRLGHDALLAAPTIRRLAPTLRAAEAPSDRIVAIQPLGSKPPFFMLRPLPVFRPLASRLGTGRPFLGVALPRGSEAQSTPNISTVARQLVSVVRRQQKKGPYYLGGWCADGVLAYEMAQQLFAQGETVALLALFDTPHPAQLRGRVFSSSISARLRAMQWRMRFQVASIRQLGWSEIPAYGWERAMALVRAAADLPRMLIVRKAAKAIRPESEHHPSGIRMPITGYEPAVYPGKLALFHVVSRSGLDPRYGWDACSGHGLAAHVVPGDHLSMFLEPHVEVLAAKLASELEIAESLCTSKLQLVAGHQ